jgi:hypothetical protein
MKTATRILAKVVYGLVGTAFLAAGASTLLVNTGLLPSAINDSVLRFSQGNLGMLHVLQEFGTLMVFAGLVTFWFVWHYEQSHAFHWFMTAYWGLMALIHWFHVAGPAPSVVGPLINTVPVALFLTIGLLRVATERERPHERSSTAAEPLKPELSSASSE